MNWNRLELGGGEVVQEQGDQFHLKLPPVHTGYADAQIDDTQDLKRSDFRWRPPLHLSLQARLQAKIPLGTAGFGFWNDPFSLSFGTAGSERRLPTTPQALWFFYGSEPNDLQLSPTMGGAGWRAMVVHSARLPSWLLLPGAGLAVLLAQIRILRPPLIRVGQGFIKASEQIVSQNPEEWHSYEILWTSTDAIFRIDGVQIHQTDVIPEGPLGFVAWIDNQYAQFSTKTGIRFGALGTSKDQVLELRDLSISPLTQLET
jgi:hypothetical protein